MENQFDVMESITKLSRMLRRKPKGEGHHSRSKHKVLRILLENDGIRAADLAAEMDIRPSSLTDVLKRLEEQGYINKVKDENDSRAYQIYATEKAKQEFDLQKQQRSDMAEQLKSCLTQAEIEAFCVTCGKMIAFLESEYPEFSTDRDGRGMSHHGRNCRRDDGERSHRHGGEGEHWHAGEGEHRRGGERSHRHDGEGEHRRGGERSHRHNGEGEHRHAGEREHRRTGEQEHRNRRG